jgi:hypothetical protein
MKNVQPVLGSGCLEFGFCILSSEIEKFHGVPQWMFSDSDFGNASASPDHALGPVRIGRSAQVWYLDFGIITHICLRLHS